MSNSVVTSYHWCDGLAIEQTGSGRLEIAPFYKWEDASGHSFVDYSYSINDVGEQLEKYKTLCEKHRDTSFNQLIISGESCSAYDFTSLTIECGQNWDADHLQGASLDDIVLFRGLSIQSFILSGYVGKMKWKLVSKLVSELVPDDMSMLSCRPFGTLTFVQLPAEPGVYPVTVKLTTDEGEVFEASADVEFR